MVNKKCNIRNYKDKCPLFNTHDKYIEAWYFLLFMVEFYHYPAPFRYNMNGFIQALRNVTFMLQSEKHKIDNFEEWYSKKQEDMTANDLLRKFVGARNYVVKKGMLKSKSTAQIGLYRRETFKMGVGGEIDPFKRSDELLKTAKDTFVGMFVGIDHDAIGEQIGVSRTWVVEDIGDGEIIQYCYKAWKDIGTILIEAHEMFNLEFEIPAFEIERVPSKQILLETDLDPTLAEKWGWI